MAEKTTKMVKPSFLTGAQFDELLVWIESAKGSVAVDAATYHDIKSPQPSKDREMTLNELVQAIFEQLGFLRQDTVEVHHQVSKLVGYPRDGSDKAEGGESPMPDDLRTKLQCLLGVVVDIRGIQGFNVQRLAQGI